MAVSVFAFLAAHRRELFPDAMFADLFPTGRGRPSVPADVMAAVITLQALHGFSDARPSMRSPSIWVESRVWAAGHRGRVSRDDVDVLAAPAGGLGSAQPGLLRGQGRDGPDRGLAGARHGGRAFEGVWDDDDYEPKRFFYHYLDEDWLLWLSNSSPWSRFGEFRTAGTGCTSSR